MKRAMKTTIASLLFLFLISVSTQLFAQYPVAQPYVVQYPAVNVTPNTVYYAPAVTGTTVYAPVAPTYYVQPRVVYRPILAAPRVTYYSGPAYYQPAYYPGAYYTARPVVVRPRVYVPGQPIRNVFRAIAP